MFFLFACFFLLKSDHRVITVLVNFSMFENSCVLVLRLLALGFVSTIGFNDFHFDFFASFTYTLPVTNVSSSSPSFNELYASRRKFSTTRPRITGGASGVTKSLDFETFSNWHFFKSSFFGLFHLFMFWAFFHFFQFFFNFTF